MRYSSEVPSDRVCPRCGECVLSKELWAVSRQDNRTKVCSACGTTEALIQAGLMQVMCDRVHTLEDDRALWFKSDILDDEVSPPPKSRYVRS